MKTNRQEQLKKAREFLDDPEIVVGLKSDLQRYAKWLKLVENNRDKFIMRGKSRTDKLLRAYIFMFLGDGQYLKTYERAIANIHFTLKSAEQSQEGDNKKNDQWDQDFHRASEIVNIEDVVRYFTGADNLRGNIACPFHEDKSPSFHVYGESNKFKCFSCGETGDSIDFVMKLKNVDFREAVNTLKHF